MWFKDRVMAVEDSVSGLGDSRANVVGAVFALTFLFADAPKVACT